MEFAGVDADNTFPTADSPGQGLVAQDRGDRGLNVPRRTSLNWANLPPAPGRPAGARAAMSCGKSLCFV